MKMTYRKDAPASPAGAAPATRRCLRRRPADRRVAPAAGPVPPCTGAARPGRPALQRLACGLLLAAALPAAAALPVVPPDATPCGGAPASGATAAAPPTAPSLLAPADGATLHGAGARFAWARDARRLHRLQVARDEGFADLVVDRDVSGTDQALVALPPGEWRWRIAALHPAARTAADLASCSDVRRFTLRPIPAAPPPEPPQWRDGVLTLGWRPGAPGESYEAELARDPLFTDIVARHAGAEPRMVLRDAAGGTLWLRVRTIDASGYGGPYGPGHAVDVPRPRWWQVLPPLTMLWWLLLL